jgi:hypothetical protein
MEINTHVPLFWGTIRKCIQLIFSWLPYLLGGITNFSCVF